MLGQTELNDLAEQKRHLIEECDRERSDFRRHSELVVSKFRWAGKVREVYHVARPVVLMGASLVGLRAASLLSRATRLLGGAFWVLRQGSRLLRRRPARAR